MFNAVEYWKNRKEGKRGQGEKVVAKIVDKNYAPNREQRRKKLPSDPKYTKKRAV